MIDVHSHILYGIDDGARTLEESLSILKQMEGLGFEKIIITPHYMENTEYVADNKKKKEIIKELKEKIKRENIHLKLYLGNEVYLFEDIVQKIKSQDIFTINQTNYLLVELPLLEHMHSDLDMLFELISSGVHIVLAHPERYVLFQKNPKLIDKYTDMGILLQGNFESFDGKYGRHAEKLAKKLLKDKRYFVLGSDIHREGSKFFRKFGSIYKKLLKFVGEDYLTLLTKTNPQKLLDGFYEEND